ncbi:MAG: hypothetical protein JXQ75_18660, partial [Phycisphaerae bacterium]|nr:hypothetical protein [Phycisphaerae bacterium]
MDRFLVCVLILLLVSPALSLAGEPDQPGMVLVGEKLDPAGYGPGIVEDMEAVLARDRARPAGELVDPKARNGQHGVWVIPSARSTYYPHSGEHNVMNKWGDTKMGIGFPDEVDVHGAWFAGQGAGEGVWATGIRVIGYRDGKEVQTTDWLDDIDSRPSWLAMNLRAVDRIVIEARPVHNGAGWFAMDDLTYVTKGQPGQDRPDTVVLDFEDCAYRQKLTGSGYAGLTWESGSGAFSVDEGIVPAPRTMPREEAEVPSEPEEEGGPRDTATLPILDDDFQGVIRGDASQWSAPPDTCGAIGPNHFVEVVNTNFSVYNRSTGTRVVNTSLSSFLPGASGDSRVLYDQHSGRWIVTVPDFNTRLYLAVSYTSDPTGSWFKTNFIMPQGSDAGTWSDYPTLGVDAYGIYVAAYMVGGNNRMTIFAIDKAPLIAASPSLGTVTAFRQLSWEGAIQPVHTYGTPSGEYFVSVASSTTIRVRRLTGPLTSPTLTETGFASIAAHSSPPDAPALGSTTPLDTVDYRLMNAVYRDGYIWTTHCISYSGRAACRWYKINASTRVVADYGTVSDSSLYYFFPSIMVNDEEDVVMGFTGSNADQYAGAYYTGRLSTDPAGQMAIPFQYMPGQAPHNIIDDYGRNRWGDYSLCSLDPFDQLTMWAVQEYGHGTNVWGTRVAKLGFDFGPDTIPPTPNPMTYAVLPACGYYEPATEIQMQAT